jgi:tRNA-dihydrouridine synthase B
MITARQLSANFPLWLAPMAGVTDSIFRGLCRELGADVVVTEFVSADGIMHRNQRTREMIQFAETERPVGVQLFGADPHKLAEAARAVGDWANPDFIDLNFGCPVNKVVAKHGGSALLRDCPLLGQIADAVVRAVSPRPVTAKIRLGWDDQNINARTTAHILEDSGIQLIAVHGRTREQSYSGAANWSEIAAVAETVTIPVIGNGDLRSANDILERCTGTKIAGAMIGRAAMTAPWLFSQIRTYLSEGHLPPDPSLESRWDHIIRHCRLAVTASNSSSGKSAVSDIAATEAERACRTEALAKAEYHVMSSMRGRLMAYTKGMPAGKQLRDRIQKVGSLTAIEDLAAEHLAWCEANATEELVISQSEFLG